MPTVEDLGKPAFKREAQLQGCIAIVIVALGAVIVVGTCASMFSG